MSFNFWYKWTVTASFLLVVSGLALILLNQSAFFNNIFVESVNEVFAGMTNSTQFQQWVYSTMGAMIVGWGIMMSFVVAYPFRKQEQWAWRCMVWSLLLWFIADSAVSAYFHVYVNILTNAIIFVIFLIPLIATRKYFFCWTRM